MKLQERNSILVYADWIGLDGPRFMGTLFSTPARSGGESFSFDYDPEWIESGNYQTLDPNLAFYTGAQYSETNFGIFMDSSPDRWGRVLMERREAIAAIDEERRERVLKESDFLLGVYDSHRMGALRFSTNPDGPFLDNDDEYASPPFTSLRELEDASRSFEKDDSQSNTHYRQWLRLLIAPGASLGGARPKASVVDPDKHLWIAKFPSVRDRYDVGAWEYVIYELAKQSGIRVGDAELRKFSGDYHTFLTKRFDRSPEGGRIHFASAMTLLGKTDGEGSDGSSYLDLVEILTTSGAYTTADLEELWRRIVFSVCISNCDDHLRNHGFLLDANGWVLSPAYDMNPVRHGNGLNLNISKTDNSQSIELVLKVAKEFRIKQPRALEIINEVVSTVKKWRKVASAVGLSRNDQTYMEQAFRVADDHSPS